MSKDTIGIKAITATKWSSSTELIAKVIVPVTNLVLARLLTPEAFGVVATATMIFSFTNMFTEAGFQKYLIQHEFERDADRDAYAAVAFWTNLSVSLFLWLVIAVFRDPVAGLVGSPKLGWAIVASCASLPLTSFSGIQLALYQRDFNYKPVFLTRMVGIAIPLAVTIPLAVLGLKYWALIIGTICGELANAIILTAMSPFKPTWFYSFSILKKMLSFSVWSLFEDVSIWLTSWVDILIVGSMLNLYDLGLYRVSMTTVNSIMEVVTNAIAPVLFSSLSRLQNDADAFQNVFFKFQRLVALVTLPLGVGVYFYRDLITLILLGRQWMSASTFLGLWGLTSSWMITFSYFSSEVYRAKGRPRLSFLVQISQLTVLIPALLIGIRYGFTALIYTRSFIRLQMLLVNLLILRLFVKMSPLKMLRNIWPYLAGSAAMGALIVLLLRISASRIWEFCSIFLCAAFYAAALMLFPKTGAEIRLFFKEHVFRGLPLRQASKE